MEDKSESEDARADILSKFTAVNQSQGAASSSSHRRRQRLLGVVVPAIDNESDYEFLPGHSEVEDIISRAEDDDNSDEEVYETRLKSGDIYMVKINTSLLTSFRFQC
jgi:hypothetical protein